jgi:alkyl sulfatase BDS1-like metallo-beta-lactamase superfamily hydrolase
MTGPGTRRLLSSEAYAATDYGWVVEILNHVLFADDSNDAAKALQPDAFEHLGFGAENGTWRTGYLAGASELRHGSFGTPTITAASVPHQKAVLLAIEGCPCWWW